MNQEFRKKYEYFIIQIMNILVLREIHIFLVSILKLVNANATNSARKSVINFKRKLIEHVCAIHMTTLH